MFTEQNNVLPPVAAGSVSGNGNPFLCFRHMRPMGRYLPRRAFDLVITQFKPMNYLVLLQLYLLCHVSLVL